MSSLKLFVILRMPFVIISQTVLPPGIWNDDYSGTEWSPSETVSGDVFPTYHGWFHRPIGSPGWRNLSRYFSQPYDSTITVSYIFIWGCDPEGVDEADVAPEHYDYGYTYINNTMYFNNTYRGRQDNTITNDVQWKVNDSEITRHCTDGFQSGKDYGIGLNATFTFFQSANNAWLINFKTFDSGDSISEATPTPLRSEEYWGVTNLYIHTQYHDTVPPSADPSARPTSDPTTNAPATVPTADPSSSPPSSSNTPTTTWSPYSDGNEYEIIIITKEAQLNATKVKLIVENLLNTLISTDVITNDHEITLNVALPSNSTLDEDVIEHMIIDGLIEEYGQDIDIDIMVRNTAENATSSPPDVNEDMGIIIVIMMAFLVFCCLLMLLAFAVLYRLRNKRKTEANAIEITKDSAYHVEDNDGIDDINNEELNEGEDANGDDDLLAEINETCGEDIDASLNPKSETVGADENAASAFNNANDPEVEWDHEKQVGVIEDEVRQQENSKSKDSQKSDLFYDERWAVQKNTNFYGIEDENVMGTDGAI